MIKRSLDIVPVVQCEHGQQLSYEELSKIKTGANGLTLSDKFISFN